MKRVFIVHGYTGYPDKNWFPWLKSELEKLGVEVVVPAMPNTEAPQFSEWLPHLRQLVGEVDEETYFVGHSLGCPTILRLLESLPEDHKVGGAVLVAGFAEPIHFSELDSFTAEAWNDEKIKQSVNKIILINSDNDEHVPLEMGQRMRDRFNAELVVVNNAGHINEKSGYKAVPFVLDELKKIMSL